MIPALTQAERILSRYDDYIKAIAYKAFIRLGHIYRVDRDDFQQEVSLALLQVLPKIDWNKKTSEIDSFLKGRMWHAIIDFVRSLDRPRASRWKSKEEVMVVLGREDDFFEHDKPAEPYPVVEMLDVVGRVNLIANQRDRIACLMALQGYTPSEIAGCVGSDVHGQRSSPCRISQVLKASGLFTYDGTGRAARRSK